MRERTSIRIVHSRADLEASLEIIHTSFQTVADEFGLTRENCPGHTAFMTLEELIGNKANGLVCFGLFVEARQVGFIGVEIDETRGDGRFWLEKLAVVPSERHNGFGKD